MKKKRKNIKSKKKLFKIEVNKKKKAPTTTEDNISKVEVEDEVEVVVINNAGISITTTPIMEKGESSTRRQCRGNPRSRYDKSQVQYYNCQKFGHYASECRTSSTKTDEKVNYVEEKNDQD